MTGRFFIEDEHVCDSKGALQPIWIETAAQAYELTDFLNNICNENNYLKHFKSNAEKVLQEEYDSFSSKVWGTWINNLSFKLKIKLRVDKE